MNCQTSYFHLNKILQLLVEQCFLLSCGWHTRGDFSTKHFNKFLSQRQIRSLHFFPSNQIEGTHPGDMALQTVIVPLYVLVVGQVPPARPYDKINQSLMNHCASQPCDNKSATSSRADINTTRDSSL